MALTIDTLTAAGRRGTETLSLPSLQSKMKNDPQSYESELRLLYNQFNSSLDLFHQQAALTFNSVAGGGVGRDPAVAKELGERAMFLAHVSPCYGKQLAEFPGQLVEFLRVSGRALPSGLRCQVAQALVLLVNRKILDIGYTLTLFMELQTLGDKTLRKMAFLHVVHSIKRLNQKHKDQGKNRALQNVLFEMLKREDESIAKRALVTLCDLHRRKVWFDDRTATAICLASLHPSSKILEAALQFLLDYEKIEDDDESDALSSEDDATPQKPQVVLSKEDVYKANHKGTNSSKKKKKAKLQRVMRSIKKQQRLTSQKNDSNYYYSPLNHLKDAQGFVEKLFSRLQTCNERFAVRMMMMKVIARTIGLHRLILLQFYPFLQRYVQPHQRDVSNLLAAAVQACHDMVPPDAVEPLFRQLVNQFVHDRSRSESIAVGLNVVREICLRIPLLMTEELLQDLVLYKKSHDKAVSSAARSLVTLFREICPSLLVKKDRGRPIDPKARPKAFGEVNVASDVAGIELLKEDGGDDDTDGADNDPTGDGNESDYDSDIQANASGSSEGDENDSDANEDVSDDNANINSESEDDELEEDDEAPVDEDGCSSADEVDSVSEAGSSDDMNDDAELHHDSGDEISIGKKRKLSDFDGQLNAADSSLRALKKIAATISDVASDGILSDEHFQRIKEKKANEEAKSALLRHGLLKKGSDSKSASFRIPSSEQLSMKRVDPAKLEARIHRKLTKEQRVELVRAGREGGKYQARTAMKQKKKGGLSNKQKEHKKAMPMAAKRAKVKRKGQEMKRKQARSKKQFRGKKAWK